MSKWKTFGKAGGGCSVLVIIGVLLSNKDEQELLMLLELLPGYILERKDFYYKETFIYSERHVFYIITSLLLNWIYELQEKG